MNQGQCSSPGAGFRGLRMWSLLTLFAIVSTASWAVSEGRGRDRPPRGPTPEPVSIDAGPEREMIAGPGPLAEVRATLPTASEVSSLDFSPDGKLLAVGDGRGGLLWDLEAMAVRACLDDQPTPVSAVRFAPGGEVLLSAGFRFSPFAGVITCWDPVGGEKLGTLFEAPLPVLSMAFAGPSGAESLAIGSRTSDGAGLVYFLDPGTGRTERMPDRLPSAVRHLAIAPDGLRIACAVPTIGSSGKTGQVVVFDAAESRERSRAEISPSPFLCSGFGPDGRTLVSAFLDMGREGCSTTIRLLDPDSGEPIGLIGEVDGAVVALAGSADGRSLGLGLVDGTIRLLDCGSGELRSAPGLHRGPIGQLAFSPDGETLASSARDRRVALWDVARLRSLPAEPGRPASEAD